MDKLLANDFRLSLLGLILLLALGPGSHVRHPLIPNFECHFVENSNSQRVSWKDRLPVHLYIHSSVPAKAYPAIIQSMEAYKRLMGREMFVIEEANVQGPPEPTQDGKSTIYWMDHWEPELSTQQARTTLYWIGSQIYEADIRVNSANFGFNFDVREPSGFVDLESLLIHELGHVLGLAHDVTPGSVMNIWLNEGQSRRKFLASNLNSLQCEY